MCFFFFFSSRRRHTRFDCDWSSDVCSSDLIRGIALQPGLAVAVDDAVQGVAVRASDAPSDVRVQVDAIRPDGSRVPVASFVTRAGWDQRYWLARPVELPKGTRLEVNTGGGRPASIQIWLDTV